MLDIRVALLHFEHGLYLLTVHFNEYLMNVVHSDLKFKISICCNTVLEKLNIIKKRTILIIDCSDSLLNKKPNDEKCLTLFLDKK